MEKFVVLKNEIVENKEKGFIRKKIANFRHFDKKQGKATRGYTYFAYIYKDRIRFTRLRWSSFNKNQGTDFVTIKYQRGNFIYSKNSGKTSLAAVCAMFNTSKMTFTKTHLIRMQRIIKEWSESLGHTYKSSKEPSLRMIFAKLSWPSLQRISKVEHFDTSKIKAIGSLLRRYLTLKEIIRKILGSCGKKTYKLVCEKIKEHHLTFVLDKLYFFKRLLSIDDIQLILNRPGFIHIPAYHINSRIKQCQILTYLKQFTKARLLSENSDDFDPLSSSLIDAVKMWEDAGKPAIERGISLKEHHELLSLQTRRLRDADFDLNPSEELLSIDGLVIDEYKIRVPRTRHELIDWGTKMNNCIASYAREMKAGYTNLFGVFENGELLYNVMYNAQDSVQLAKDNFTPISPIRQLIQFYGRYNSKVNPEIVKEILEKLPFKINGGSFVKSRDEIDAREYALQAAFDDF